MKIDLIKRLLVKDAIGVSSQSTIGKKTEDIAEEVKKE